jgi:hypothetical protein
LRCICAANVQRLQAIEWRSLIDRKAFVKRL